MTVTTMVFENVFLKQPPDCTVCCSNHLLLAILRYMRNFLKRNCIDLLDYCGQIVEILEVLRNACTEYDKNYQYFMATTLFRDIAIFKVCGVFSWTFVCIQYETKHLIEYLGENEFFVFKITIRLIDGVNDCNLT